MVTKVRVPSIVWVAVFAVAGTVAAREVGYLGLATESLDPMVGRHLGLGEGVGLAVVHVDPKGAVAGKVEEGDILVKFNDQILVTPQQLAVLVRRERPGETVRLTVHREGKTQTIEVKLGSRNASELPPLVPGRGQFEPPFVPGIRAWTPEDMDRWMEQFHRRWWRGFGRPFDEPEREEAEAAPEPRAKPSPRVEVHTSSSATVTEARDGTSVSVTIQDGDRRAKIVKNGTTVFEGPINNDQEIGAIPKEYREWVERLLQRVKINVQTVPPSKPPRRTGTTQGTVL